MAESLTNAMSPTDWIRIFASHLARRRPNVCAEEVLALSIDHFRRCHELAPEIAAERFNCPQAGGSASGQPEAARRGI